MPPIRLFKASSFHAGALAAFYAERPGLAEASHADQWRALCSDLLVGTDFWQEGLEASGKFVVFETVLNCAPLQHAWARENGVDDRETLGILLAQIECFAPIVLFSHDFEILNPEFRSEARRRAPSIRLVFGWDGIARNDYAKFSGCGIMLSCIPHVVDFYKSQGADAYLFPYSFADKLVNHLPQGDSSIPLSFVGSVQLKSRLHFQRAKLLYRALRELPLSIHGTGSITKWRLSEREQRRRLRHFEFRLAWVAHVLGKANRGELFGMPMFAKLAKSSITLNIHIDAARGQASNMRLFEATGAGACLLTDWQEDLGNYFEPDVEVATFRNADELVSKARFLLDNPDERERIAQAGRARTMREHLFSHRVGRLEEILLRHL